MNACPDTASAPATVTWRVRLGDPLTLCITVIDGQWHWRGSEPNAQNSRGYPSYPAVLAAARHALGLPPIAAQRT